MNAIKAQRGMLARCAGILQRPCFTPSQRVMIVSQQQNIMPLCQLQSYCMLGCHLTHRSVTSHSTPRFVVACASDSTESETVELEIKVEGMKCGGCSSRVEKALKAMDHVKSVQVDLESKLATVEVESASLIDAMNMLPSFVTTVKELGFEAEPHIEYQT